MLEYLENELVSMSVFDIHPAENQALLEFFQSVSQRGYGWTDQLTCMTKTGPKASTQKFPHQRLKWEERIA